MSIPPGSEPGQADHMNSRQFLVQEGCRRFCDGCGQMPYKDKQDSCIPLKRCTKCKHAWYHNRDCQLAHLPDHKAQCKIWSQTIRDEPRLEAYPFVKELQNDSITEGAAEIYDRLRDDWSGNVESWEADQPDIGADLSYNTFFLPTCFDGDKGKKVDVVLDFGCGTGSLSRILRHHVNDKVIALDLAPKMIERLNQSGWGNVVGIAGCLVNMDDPVIRAFRETYRGKIDFIVWTTVLPYIPPMQTKATFMAFHDLLKPGGRIAHIDYDKASPMAQFPNYICYEECETYYQWGKLEKEMLETRELLIHLFVHGVARKPMPGEDWDEVD